MNAVSNASVPWNIAVLNPQEAPWHLLLAADPSRERVQRYLRACTGFGARETTPGSPEGRGAILGICLLRGGKPADAAPVQVSTLPRASPMLAASSKPIGNRPRR